MRNQQISADISPQKQTVTKFRNNLGGWKRTYYPEREREDPIPAKDALAQYRRTKLELLSEQRALLFKLEKAIDALSEPPPEEVIDDTGADSDPND